MHCLRRSVAIVVVLVASLQIATSSRAEVTRIEALSSQSFGLFRSGEFTRIDLRVIGELVPGREPVADLEKATRNARGTVEYATRIVLLVPQGAESGNGALLIDVPNRGRAIAQGLFNSPRSNILQIGQIEPGNGFLQDQGFIVAVVSWELGYGIDLPTFKGEDGELIYIEGAALPIMRDVVDFLTHARVDVAGNVNPLAGTTRRTIALGYSQTGRFLKSFVLQGYNQAQGRQVFNGVHILGAASGGIQLRSHPGPQSGAGIIPTFENSEMRGVAEEPLAIAQIVDRLRQRNEDPPKMVFVNTTTDYFSLRASLGRTGSKGTADLPVPGNVRMYDVAGASHALVAGKSQCKYAYAVLDWHPVMRSTLLALDRWVAADIAPPASELMPLAPAPTNAMVLKAPSYLQAAVVQIPALDADGNAVGGIRLPDMEAPLGAHAVQNPPLSFLCSLAGGYRPFPKMKAEGAAPSDPSLSLAERYRNHAAYIARIRSAALALERRRLLLRQDAEIILDSASAAELAAVP